MSVLFGHPSGNPNSHQAALAHFESGRLEAFCVPWFPSALALRILEGIAPLSPLAQRVARRNLPALSLAPKIQGRAGEWLRLLQRALGLGSERLSYEANDWLMRTMRRESRRSTVTAVHSYEDCSLWQFEEAKRLGKACVYDMPIGYYSAWEKTQDTLARKYSDWLPGGGLLSSRFARPEQKRKEMDLADLVLVPSEFVERTVLEFHPHKRVVRAAYGVDLEFWRPAMKEVGHRPLRFVCAGQLSLRKGIPLLLLAWEAARLHDAELELVGMWQLDERRLNALPRGVMWRPPCSREGLRERLQKADVFVFPSFFEGFALALLEAMACGLPVLGTNVTDAYALPNNCGRLLPIGEIDAMVEGLKWFNNNREMLPEMGSAARRQSESFSWKNYRRCVSDAVAPYV